MRLLGKSAMVLGLAGAMALGAMTTSEARGFHHRGGFAAGAVGFAAGAAIGAAAANSNYYYGDPGYAAYGYDPGYVAPGYSYDGPAAAYTGDPAYNNGYGRGYSRYYNGGNSSMRERVLEGHDY